MKFAKFNGIKTHARQVVSGSLGRDLWFNDKEVVACIGKYRQYWKYTDSQFKLPRGYEHETEWHSAWKYAVIDEACEVICGKNREHRADIKTDKFIVEIQKSPIDGRNVIERNNFYKDLTGARVVWVVNIEEPWMGKRISTNLIKTEKDGRFTIDWKYKWKWVKEISDTTDTLLFLDFNAKSDKLIYMWSFKDKISGSYKTFGKWVTKKSFFDIYLSSVAKEKFKNGEEDFLDVFKQL